MRAAPFALVLATVACTPSWKDQPAAVYNPDGGSIFDAPWPSDARLTEDGTPDLTGFPNPASLPIVDNYVANGEARKGWGLSSPIYLRLDSAISESDLPTPEITLGDESPIVLVDVDPTSAHWGERFPLQVEWRPDSGSYLPGNLLALAPVYGFPLRPDTTYALVVTTDLLAPSEGFAEVWSEDHPDHEIYQPLDDALYFLHLSRRDVAVATVFTTQDPLEEMDRMVRFTRENIGIPDLSQQVKHLETNLFYSVYEGSYPGPNFQHGDIPYQTTGGGFRFDDHGAPIIHHWDEIRMAISTPKDLSDPPANGWPVLVYAHGTGGDYRSFCNAAKGLEVASQLSKAGIIGIGIDQPLHGPRGTSDTDPELHSFNFLNPEAAQANFRQGALDTVYLVHALKSQQVTLTTDDGHTLPLDTSHLTFLGHSQGGLTGALAAPWMGNELDSMVLSGAGGVLSITIVERKDPFDWGSFVRTVAGFSANEEISEMHPLIGLVQQLVEVTDPVNYSPYWYSQEPGWDSKPVSILLSSGRNDAATPYRTAEAMAAAARMPIVTPSWNHPEAFALRGLDEVDPVVVENIEGYDGEPITAAMSQWPEGTHYVLFEDATAARMYRHYLESTLEGTPEIDNAIDN